MAHLIGLSMMDLLLKKCLCGHLTIHGFPQQVEWLDDEAGTYFDSTCEKCGASMRRYYDVVDDGDEYICGGGI